jgi:hypothetical protein
MTCSDNAVNPPDILASMLEGLDEKPWSKLSHAYGKAANEPDLVRALASPSAKKRGEAIFNLGAAICHKARCTVRRRSRCRS